MEGRLSSLSKLLESKNAAVRRQAAKNFGSLQNNYPEDLGKLLFHLVETLKKTSWEARIAASDSVREILKSVSNSELISTKILIEESSEPHSLDNFNLGVIFQSFPLLVGSERKYLNITEQDIEEQRLQRSRIDQKLGFHPQFGFDSRDWYSDEDLINPEENSVNQPLNVSHRNEEEERIDLLNQLNAVSLDASDILKCFLKLLLIELKSPWWERRHGGALALKQCVTCFVYYLHHSAAQLIAVKLLETLALDRFNDFVESQATAPVRETCAQVVSLLAVHMGSSCFNILLDIILNYVTFPSSWECRHGGFLVLKYLVAAVQNSELCVQILSLFKELIVKSLEDENDEIAAAATQVLLPVSKKIAELWNTAVLLPFAWNLLARWTSNDEAAILSLLGVLCVWLQLESETAKFFPDDHQLNLLLKLLDHNALRVRELAFECLTVVMAKAERNALDNWSDVSLQLVFRVLYRRILLEPENGKVFIEKIARNWQQFLTFIGSEKVIRLICPYLGVWLACLMVADSNPFLNCLVSLETENEIPEIQLGDVLETDANANKNNSKDFIGGVEVLALDEKKRIEIVTGNKHVAATVLGQTFNLISGCTTTVFEGGESPSESVSLLLQVHLSSPTTSQRSAVALTLFEWARYSTFPPSNTLVSLLKLSLMEPPLAYDDTGAKLAELNKGCSDFLTMLMSHVADVEMPDAQTAVSPDSALIFCRKAYNLARSSVSGAVQRKFDEAWKLLSSQVSQITDDIQVVNRRLNCLLSCAALSWQLLPEKFNPVVKPLMDCIKVEDNSFYADIAADGLALLIELTKERKPCPSAKIIKNLVLFHCSNPLKTPVFRDFLQKTDEIVSLNRLKATQLSTNRRSTTRMKEVTGDTDSATESAAENAGHALQKICKKFKWNLEKDVPELWALIFDLPEITDQDTVNRLQTLETVISLLGENDMVKLFQKHSDRLLIFLFHENPAIRYGSCCCLSKFAQCSIVPVMNRVIPVCLEKIGDLELVPCRLGIVEFFYNLSMALEEKLVGFISLLSPAILGRMSDPYLNIRSLASICFSNFIALLPLESNVQEIAGVSLELRKLLQRNKNFLTLLTNPSGLETLNLPLRIKEVELRPYQKEGVTWLWFLNQYFLHGILCDDMGLGKTVQALCVMAMSHIHNKPKFPSLIVCPKTLIAHWMGEIKRFFYQNESPLRAVAIERLEDFQVEEIATKYTVVITAYDTVRRSSEAFLDRLWHYCVLDEGHIVRNAKTQLFKVITSLKAEHRLILSGTPVQNSVLELWTLFQFLMPSYLGTEQSFNVKFVKPVVESRDAKLVSNQEESAGERALESLHKLVLPFILRRQKIDVLKDLPPKIVQDYFCNLSPLQRKLYEHFGTRVTESGLSLEAEESGAGKKMSALAILTYLRKLCDHPSLVLTPEHPEFPEVSQNLKESGCKLADVELSGKMVGLKELLSQCGIGVTATETGDDDTEINMVVPQHRALVFCQFKVTLDLIENYLKSGSIGSEKVGWLRLDGSVPPKERQSVVDRFNSDPSVDLLLLTTQVGGLGLNLVGADIVIFVDHDWNPVKDIQAMDRAHRLGQKRTVNVYRLITQGTLEEKIMKVQKFKTHTAEVLIGDDNRSLLSMATDQLLDLLSLEKSTGDDEKTVQKRKRQIELKGAAPRKKSKLKTLDSCDTAPIEVSELWDKSQYDEAFDMNDFLKLLKK